jgi:hypothetical protein
VSLNPGIQVVVKCLAVEELSLVLSQVASFTWLLLNALLDLVSATIRSYTTPTQLTAAMQAWELACLSGWNKPAPEWVYRAGTPTPRLVPVYAPT